MQWWQVVALAAGAMVVLGLLLYWAVKALSAREPYRSFMKLSTRNKAAFFKGLLKDGSVPWWVKSAPLLLVVYLAIPIDLIPDFIPVLGYMDDVGVVLLTLAFVLRFTPKTAVARLLGELGKAAEGDTT
ncbi:MAG: DUF1232 domain-containing protein [Chloroflexi bacterium]|nr:DUF1232 domain-containing protein [Chloroflexota bacterium]